MNNNKENTILKSFARFLKNENAYARFRVNFFAPSNKYRRRLFLERVINGRIMGINQCIDYSLTWENTNEHSEYWSRLYNKAIAFK